MITHIEKGGSTMPYYCTDEFISRLKELLGEERFLEEKEIANAIIKNNYDEISVLDISQQTEMTNTEKRVLYSYYVIQQHIPYMSRVQHVRGMKQSTLANQTLTDSNLQNDESLRSYANRKGELVYYAMAMEQYQDWNQYCRSCYDESFEDHVLQATANYGNKQKSLKRSERHI